MTCQNVVCDVRDNRFLRRIFLIVFEGVQENEDSTNPRSILTSPE